MKTMMCTALMAAVTLASTNTDAAVISRLYVGNHHFYTSSQAEALSVAATGGTLEALSYFGTYDTAQAFSTDDLLRCYSPSKGVHAYVPQSWVGGSCAAIGYQNEGTLGKIRLRTYESTPIPGYGVPLYSMYRSIGRAADGSNITVQFITRDPGEAAALCGNGWIWTVGASPQTCLLGYGW